MLRRMLARAIAVTVLALCAVQIASASTSLVAFFGDHLLQRDPAVRRYVSEFQMTKGHVEAVNGVPRVVGIVATVFTRLPDTRKGRTLGARICRDGRAVVSSYPRLRPVSSINVISDAGYIVASTDNISAGGKVVVHAC